MVHVAVPPSRRLVKTVTAHAGDAVAPSWPAQVSHMLADFDGVACASRFAEQGVEKLTTTPTRVVRCGVDLPPRRGQRAREPVLRVLTVARVVPKKGHGVATRSLHALAAEHVHWVFIGDGPGLPQLREELALLTGPSVGDAVGYQSHAEVLKAMNDWADVFVLPSRVDPTGDSDGIPVVLLEAMARSVPVITTNVGGIAELVTHEVNGLVVRPDDAGELAAAIRRLQNDGSLRAHLAESARDQVEATYTVAGETQKLVDLWSAMLSTGTRARRLGSGR